MFENIINLFKKFNKKENKVSANSKDAAKERLHLVLMQDRANVSADFLELMKQEIIDVIKKYIDVDEKAIDVRLTNKENEDGTNGAPALYANIPIVNIKNETRKIEKKESNEKIEEKNSKVKEKSDKEKVESANIEKEDGKDKKEIKVEENKETKKEVETEKKDKDLEKNKENQDIETSNKDIEEEKKETDKSKDEIKSEN